MDSIKKIFDSGHVELLWQGQLNSINRSARKTIDFGPLEPTGPETSKKYLKSIYSPTKPSRALQKSSSAYHKLNESVFKSPMPLGLGAGTIAADIRDKRE